MEASGDTLVISDADAVTVYVSADTDYKMTIRNTAQARQQSSCTQEWRKDIESAAEKGYEAVKADHIADYSELFSRVELNLGRLFRRSRQMSCWQRTRTEAQPLRSSVQLEVMLFQYGRYLTLGSSRADSELPSTCRESGIT